LIILEPLKPISHSIYLCDSRFHTDFLREQISANETRIGFVIIDGHSTTFHLLCGNTKETLVKFDVNLPNKQGRGGQSQNRFERIRVEKRGWYVSKVIELFTQYFMEAGQLNVSYLIFGGCASFKSDLAKKLDSKITDKILAMVDLQYGGEAGFHQAVELSASVLKNTRFMKEQNILQKFFDQIVLDGRYCYSPSSTISALEGGLIETLIVYEDLQCFRTELVSVNDPSEKKIVYKQFFEDNYSGYKIVSSLPLLDWILEHYKEFGSHLELVSSTTSISNQFIEGFGGIGGILRFKSETLLDETKECEEEEEEEESEYDYVY